MSNEAPPVAPSPGRRTGKRAAQAAAREARKADTARKWKKYALPAGVVLLVVALIAGAVALFGGDDGGSPSGSPSGRSQSTLLVQLVPQVGRATVGNALTATDPSKGNGVFLALPGRLVTDVPGRGSTTLDQTSVTADGKTAGEAVADQLGVMVDGSWVLTGPAMAALIDKVGGVTVDVDVDVTTRSGASTVVTIPKGSARQLDGAQAVAYATYLAPGEPEPSRMARFTDVWRALLEKLPSDVDATRNLVAGSAGSVSSLPPDQLAAYLVSLHEAVVGDAVAYPTLPTVTVDSGSGPVSYRVDGPKVPALVKVQFAGSLPPARAGGPVGVLVQNGVGTPGLTEKARAKLLGAGLTYKDGGNASRFGYPTSVVLVPDASAKARQNGTDVATALGLPASAVRLSSQGQTLADVVVILGADFRG